MAETKEMSVSPNKDSVYAKYCPSCADCGKEMDHPPFEVPTGPGFFETRATGLKPVLSVPTKPICRFCMLVAIATVDTPMPEHPKVGWLWRLITSGGLEPLGTKNLESY